MSQIMLHRDIVNNIQMKKLLYNQKAKIKLKRDELMVMVALEQWLKRTSEYDVPEQKKIRDDRSMIIASFDNHELLKSHAEAHGCWLSQFIDMIVSGYELKEER